jgi:hypothetical protein
MAHPDATNCARNQNIVKELAMMKQRLCENNIAKEETSRKRNCPKNITKKHFHKEYKIEGEKQHHREEKKKRCRAERNRTSVNFGKKKTNIIRRKKLVRNQTSVRHEEGKNKQ